MSARQAHAFEAQGSAVAGVAHRSAGADTSFIDAQTISLGLSSPPAVRGVEWALALAAPIVSGLSFLLPRHEELGALAVVLAAIAVLLLGLTGLEALRTGAPGKFFLVASSFVFFWLEALASAQTEPPFAVPGGLPVPASQFDARLVQSAYVFIALFQLSLLAGYSVRPPLTAVVRWTANRVDGRSLGRRLLAWAYALCALAPVLAAYRGDLDDVVAGLVAARSGSGPEREDIGFLHYLTFVGMYGSGLLLTRATLARGLRATVLLAGGVVTALPFVLVGSRHPWMFVIFPVCLLTLAKTGEKAAVASAARWAVSLAALVLVAQLQFALRGTGWADLGRVEPAQLAQTNATGQFTALLFAEYLVPDVHPYFLELAEPYFLIHWIPRQWWPEKPVMESWSYYNAMYTQGRAFNVTPSIIGQAYINWGVPGIVAFGVWLGFLAYVADRALLALNVAKQSAMAVTIGQLYAFIVSSFRFYSPVYFTYMAVGVAAMLLTTSNSALPLTSGLVRGQAVPMRGDLETHNGP